MPINRIDEIVYSLDEEKKRILGQRTIVDEFDTIEIQQQVEIRNKLIVDLNKQIDDYKKEIEQINKFKSYIDKWGKEFVEEQKKGVAKFKEELNANKKVKKK